MVADWQICLQSIVPEVLQPLLRGLIDQLVMFDIDQQSKVFHFACSFILSNEKLATDVIRNT